MIISSDFDVKERELVVSCYDENGEIALLRKPIHESDMFVWSKSDVPSEHRNWDGKFLTQAPSKYLPKFRIEEMIESRLSKREKDMIYSGYDPKKYYLDIEIQLLDTSFPHPEEARMPVNLITVVNPTNVAYVLSTMKRFSAEEQKRLQDETNEYFEKIKQKNPIQVKYVFFETEEEMMTTFFHKILPKIPFLTGWNVVEFDWLYLVNRARRIGIDPMKKMIGKLIGKANMPTHIGLVDYMEVFQMIKPFKVVENHKLDYISNLVLGVSKLKGTYSNMLDAQKDEFNFVKYNIVDTVLVKFMEDKLNLLSVVFSISKVARIEVSKIFSNVFIAETLMCREFLKRGKHLNNDKRTPPEKSTYEGAFVMPPVPGYYKFIMLYDFASMYPNTQIQFNISPDSYIGKGPAENQFEIYTKNNTRFTNRFDSVSRTILSDMYDERKRLKKVMKMMKETIKERQKHVKQAA